MEIISGTINDSNFHLFDEVLTEVYSAYPHNKNFVQKVNVHLADQYHLVMKDGKALARCITYKNEHILYEHETPILFGNFESVNNREVVELLFSAIKTNATNRNIIGPISGSTWYDYRIALPSPNALFFTEFYTPAYYQELLYGEGFTCLASYKSTFSKTYEVNEKKLEEFKKLFNKKNIHIRNFDVTNFEQDLEHIFQVSIDGFKNNLFYSPISKEEFFAKYLPLKNVINSSTVFLAFENHTCVGFCMSLINLFNKEKKQLIMKSAARLPDLKYKGLGTYFSELTKKAAKESGYKELIFAFFIDDSVSERTFSSANGSDLYRAYELLIKRNK